MGGYGTLTNPAYADWLASQQAGQMTPLQKVTMQAPAAAPAPPSGHIAHVLNTADSMGGPVAPDPATMAAAMPQPKVTMDRDPLHQVEGHAQNQLQQDYWKDENPWGTPDNHPGKLGKIAHVLSRIGNIAGDAIIPETMARIPGTELNRKVEEQGLVKQLGDVTGEESRNASENATTAATTLATAEAPQKAEDTHALTESEISAHNATAASLLHPQAKTDFEAWQQQNPNKPIEEWLKAMAANKDTKPDPARQQLVDEYQKTHPGATLAKANEYASAALQAPQRAPVVQMFVPGANGQSTLEQIHAGQTVAPGAQTAAGLSSMNTPTSMQRNAGGRADIVLSAIPDVLQDLRANASELGPGMGRFNDIYSGKIGAPNEKFSGLMADLHLLGTAVALAHAQGRMSNELLKEFNTMIASPQQSPANIEAVLSKVQRFMERASQQGKRPTDVQPSGDGTPPAGAKVRDYTSLGGK